VVHFGHSYNEESKKEGGKKKGGAGGGGGGRRGGKGGWKRMIKAYLIIIKPGATTKLGLGSIVGILIVNSGGELRDERFSLAREKR